MTSAWIHWLRLTTDELLAVDCRHETGVCLLPGLFWRNPQFGVTISSPSPDDRDHMAHMVVSLIQESIRMDQNFSIGLMIYKVTARWRFCSVCMLMLLVSCGCAYTMPVNQRHAAHKRWLFLFLNKFPTWMHVYWLRWEKTEELDRTSVLQVGCQSLALTHQGVPGCQ